MKFNEYLKIMNCYFGIDKSQYAFMKEFFALFVTEPFSDEDTKKDADDSYYPFSSLCAPDTAKRIFLGTRSVPKALARFMLSHFNREKCDDALLDMGEEVLANLSADLTAFGIVCNVDDVTDAVASTLHKFLVAALDENDTIQTGILAQSTVTIQSDNSILLLLEVDNKCPLCGKALTRKGRKGMSVADCSVTQIFPMNVDKEKYVRFNRIHQIEGDYNCLENLIMLCPDCSVEYSSNPTVEEYSQLVKIKEALQQNQKMQQDLSDINIEEDIQSVVNGLVTINDTGRLVALKMDALKIDQKIEKNNILLKDSITGDVTRYYKYIESLFASIDEIKSGTFELIASEIRQAYLKIKSQGITQDEIFQRIVDWLYQKLCLERKCFIAVRIVTSFFVQNCEVFDEISE